MSHCALIMAGGTAGHIFPGLALAKALHARGWRVHWLGGCGSAHQPSMESQLIPPQGFAFEAIDFGGLRGKGLVSFVLLPLRLLKAFWQSIFVLRRIQPDVVLGMGGYVSFPAGLMAVLLGKPLVLHEQNSVAGLTNKVLSCVADRVFTAFPNVIRGAHWVGNPLREAFLNVPPPDQRLAGREGQLRILVVGGSLGAQALNELMPQALARLPIDQRPTVLHQSGDKHLEALLALYEAAQVTAQVTPFIDNTAQAFADADLVICRAGASTVTELAAVGAAAVLVPFPFAVDDHQTSNARFLADNGAAHLVQQSQLTPQYLADLLQNMKRSTLIHQGLQAKKMQKLNATERIVATCEELITMKTIE